MEVHGINRLSQLSEAGDAKFIICCYRPTDRCITKLTTASTVKWGDVVK